MRVLIVEDEPLIAMDLAEMLAQLGHETVATVRTVEDALNAVRLRPDVVLLDINLGGQMSYDVANHCTLEGIPVVLTTGYQVSDVPEGLRHCPVLSKPTGPRELDRAMDQATSTHAH